MILVLSIIIQIELAYHNNKQNMNDIKLWADDKKKSL